MPYYWKAYNTLLAEFENEEDAKETIKNSKKVGKKNAKSN